jgi:geranylgeranyl reductase family protein
MTNDSGQNAGYDVVIVGAGPAGSACATLLGRAGFRVLLCDKAVFPRHKICGETVNPRAWDSFDTLGVADEIERRIGDRISSISVTNRAGRETRVELGHEEGRPFITMGRDVLDQVLAQAAINAGAEFRDGATVTGVTWEECWRVEIRDRKGAGRAEFTAGHLVGADGRNSIVARHLMALQESPRRVKKQVVDSDRVGVQWHARPNPQLAGALQMYLFDTGYCGLVNVGGRHTNVAMVTAPELAASAKADFRSFLNKTIWSNPVAASRFSDLSPVGEITATSPINPRRNQLNHPHATLAGDASQTVEPFTGEGIRYALEDGMAAAGTLIRRRRGASGDAPAVINRFRVNRVFSPILRRPGIRDGLVSLGARFPSLSRWVAATVVARRGGKSR